MNSNKSNSDNDEFLIGGTFCSICLQSLFMQPQPPVTMSSPSSSIGACIPCGHCFHAACFQQWDATYLSTSDDVNPTCPLCKVPTSYFLDLKWNDSLTNDSHKNELLDPLRCFAKSPSSYTIGAYVPCGHFFLYDEQQFGNSHISWDELVTISIRQYEFTYSSGEASTNCQSCQAALAGYIRLFVEPLNALIDKIQRLAPNPKLDEPCPFLAVIPAIGPSHITISEAGITAINGDYFYSDQQNKANRYIRVGIWNNLFCQFNVFVRPYLDGQYAWNISISLQGLGTCTDINFYRAAIAETSHEIMPPRDGWVCLMESYADAWGGTMARGALMISYKCSTSTDS